MAPGDYNLTVRSVRIMTSDGGDMMTFRATIGGDGTDGEAANLPLVVSGEDMANVVIVTSKGATASGRLVFEGSGCLGTLEDLAQGAFRLPAREWCQSNYFHDSAASDWTAIPQ